MMKMISKKLLLVLLIFLVLMSFTHAQDEPNTFITLKDINTQEQISNILVSLELDNIKSIQHVPTNETLRLHLSEGEHNITIVVDDILTGGKDYFKTVILDSTSTELYLFQIGSVQGIVKDNLDNIIPDAELKCECNTDISKDFQSATDNFGSFNSIVPVGKCKIFATYKDKLGYIEIDTIKGELKDVEIILDKKLSSNLSIIYYIIIVIIILVLIFIFVLKKDISFFKKKEVILEKKNYIMNKE